MVSRVFRRWRRRDAIPRDRRGQATAVVLGFVVVAGLYLGVADAAAKWLVDRII